MDKRTLGGRGQGEGLVDFECGELDHRLVPDIELVMERKLRKYLDV